MAQSLVSKDYQAFSQANHLKALEEKRTTAKKEAEQLMSYYGEMRTTVMEDLKNDVRRPRQPITINPRQSVVVVTPLNMHVTPSLLIGEPWTPPHENINGTVAAEDYAVSNANELGDLQNYAALGVLHDAGTEMLRRKVESMESPEDYQVVFANDVGRENFKASSDQAIYVNDANDVRTVVNIYEEVFN
jgi:hypothetical protein